MQSGAMDEMRPSQSPNAVIPDLIRDPASSSRCSGKESGIPDQVRDDGVKTTLVAPSFTPVEFVRPVLAALQMGQAANPRKSKACPDHDTSEHALSRFAD